MALFWWPNSGFIDKYSVESIFHLTKTEKSFSFIQLTGNGSIGEKTIFLRKRRPSKSGARRHWATGRCQSAVERAKIRIYVGQTEMFGHVNSSGHVERYQFENDCALDCRHLFGEYVGDKWVIALQCIARDHKEKSGLGSSYEKAYKIRVRVLCSSFTSRDP